MSEHLPNIDAQNSTLDSDDSGFNDTSASQADQANIYAKDSINPAKRRRLEALREEKELERDIGDLLEEYDFDE